MIERRSIPGNYKWRNRRGAVKGAKNRKIKSVCMTHNDKRKKAIGGAHLVYDLAHDEIIMEG
jgi:hypothetical protein